MSRSPSTFRRRDLMAAMKAAAAAGVEVARYEIENDGKIIVIVGKPADDAKGGNEWDEV
jgi:hypothetical protein